MEWLAEIERRSALGDVPPGDVPWVPPILANVPPEVVRTLRYVVLDDVDDAEGDVVLVAGPWPTVDVLGRVRHAPEAAREQYVPVTKWMRLLERRRVPEPVRDRPPRIGDTFAMRLGRSGDVARPVGPVVDVTADAREAARASFYGAVALPMDPALAARVRDPEAGPHLVVEMPEEWR
ncbi:MAG TPA: hypothetical protein VGX28_02895 [Frankiaceae bacterium]|jgi:hypothetical protein|nr:hypothetical protein [Frankiaceae bacterium]